MGALLSSLCTSLQGLDEETQTTSSGAPPPCVYIYPESSEVADDSEFDEDTDSEDDFSQVCSHIYWGTPLQLTDKSPKRHRHTYTTRCHSTKSTPKNRKHYSSPVMSYEWAKKNLLEL